VCVCVCVCVCSRQIPSLVSLKRQASVAFVGVDTLDDIRNNSCNELFVSGGCVVSDDFVLSPEFITCGNSITSNRITTNVEKDQSFCNQ